MLRKIIHIDMDAFFASVEQRDFPKLQGKPVCVGGSKERGVVAAASYEARKYGIHSAMSSALAYRKCPEVIFVPTRFEVYKEVSTKIHAIFRDYTDVIEPLSLDEAFLDVTMNKKGMKSATMIAQEIKDRIKSELNLIASAGVSINKFLAKVASDQDKPDGLFVITPDEVDEFIAHLPIKKFHGIGKVTAQEMNRLGVYFGKDLQRYSEQDLILRFKSRGSYFYNICRGIDHRPVKAERKRKSVGCEKTLSQNVVEFQEIKEVVLELVPRLMKRWEKTQLGMKTLTLKVKFSDFKQITRSVTNEAKIDSKETVLVLIDQLLTEFKDNEKEIRLLGLTLSNLSEEDKKTEEQLTLRI